MKKGFKIIVAILILSVFAGGVIYVKDNYPDMFSVFNRETKTAVEITKETLTDAKRLETADYMCTCVKNLDDSKKIKDWNIPFTKKSLVVSYEGLVTAGIKDLSKAEIVEQDEKTLIVKLPEVEVISAHVDPKSFKKLDESNGLFNKLDMDDYNAVQVKAEKEIKDKAIKYGLLDRAKKSAETTIKAMLKNASGEKEIVVEWK